MSVRVLTAVTDAVWEADLLSALDRADLGITVVRRCVDLADLLASAASGTARAVLLSADLRRLDRDALTRLGAAGVAVVGLVEVGDEQAERRLRQLGVAHVLPADAGAPVISAAVLEAVAGAVGRRPGGYADPAAALPDLADAGDRTDERHNAATTDGDAPTDGADPDAGPGAGDPGGSAVGPGRLVAVWGPTGAPGRTTVAVGLADEAARLGTATLLVDADVYGGVVGQVLGLLDEAPGLAAAARLAGHGTLDRAALAGLARTVTPGLRVLTGISRADRWPELRAASVEAVLDQCRSVARCTVVDCGFSLEQDEEVVYDTAAPRRNGVTLAALEAADTVLAVGTADPVGLHRLIRGLDALRAVHPDVEPLVVVNRLRRHVIAGDPAREVAAALERYAGVSDRVFLPYDLAGTDAALAAGRTLGEAAPKSPLRQALVALARRLLRTPTPAGAVPTMSR